MIQAISLWDYPISTQIKTMRLRITAQQFERTSRRTKSLSEQELEFAKKGQKTDVDSHMARFYASALKHDLEVLLLAATSQLQSRLKTQDKLSGWRRPPEDQNQNKPPKRIVEELFSKYRKGHPTTWWTVLFSEMLTCDSTARYSDMIDWIAKRLCETWVLIQCPGLR